MEGRRGVGVLMALLGLLAPLSAAEEAWRSDGRLLRGSLTLNDGQLRFQPTEGAAVSSANLTRIRFAGSTATPFRVGGGHRLRLWDGQRITGQILSLNKDILMVRTAWSARLEVPRVAVAGVDALPGWRIVADEDFHDDCKAFATAGEPRLTEAEADTKARALLLDRVGQRLTYTVAKPLLAGRVGVNFQERGQPRGARWTMELLFQQGERARRVTVTVAGDGEHYRVDTAGLTGTARRVARTPGWHRLIVQFGKRSLRLTCDEDVLWYNLDKGPGGRLRRVTIHCQQAGEGETPRGALAWTEFCVERAVDEHPKPPTVDEQDEIRFADDDQLFGRIVRANRYSIEIEGRFGKRALPWTEVCGCSFRRPGAAKAAARANVRLRLRSGLSQEDDVLEGVLTALDERRLVLRHALLGDLTFERGRVRELQPLPAGSK